MSFPIQKSITNEKTLPVLQAHGNICASSLSLASSLLTAWFMARVEGAVALPSLFILGGILFLLSGICMMRMNEQDTLCRYAAQPVLPEIHEALGIPLLRKQLAAGFVLNLMLVMMPAVCVLAAKEGCGLHDSEILVLTSMQVLSSVVAARCCQLGTLRWGAWTMIMATCPLVFVLGIYWWLVPAGCSWPCLIVPFVICGIISIFFSTSMGNYFIVSMPERLQIPGTFLLFVLTGGAPGLVGLVLNPTIFHFVSRLPKTSALTPYRWFFFIGTVLYLLGLPLILRLPRHYR